MPKPSRSQGGAVDRSASAPPLRTTEAPPLPPRQALDLPERADKPQAGTQTDTQTLAHIDTDSYTYWRDGYFYFDNTPLKEVVQELGRWYNINIVFENEKLMDLHIRYFCVRSETLERAISLLNRMKKIHATLSGNTIYIR